MSGVEAGPASAGPVVVAHEGVELRWTGGRLADVWMPTRYDPVPHAVECLDTGLYDWEAGAMRRAPTPSDLRPILSRWMREEYATCWENA